MDGQEQTRPEALTAGIAARRKKKTKRNRWVPKKIISGTRDPSCSENKKIAAIVSEGGGRRYSSGATRGGKVTRKKIQEKAKTFCGGHLVV